MKKTKYFAWLIAAGMAMSGCSDEMDGPGTGTTPIDGESGYIKVALNLPTTSGPTTRADKGLGNDDFDDGIKSEYEVKDAMLVIFQGTNEATAKATTAISLTDLFYTEDIEQDENITTRLVLDPIKVPKSEYKTYALAILNNNELLKITDGDLLEYNGSPFSGTISELQTVLSGVDDASDVTSKGFLMTNSPLLTGPSGTNGSNWTNSSLYILPQVTVFDTETQASGSAGTDIYVERVVAKVTATFTSKANNGQIEVGSEYGEYAGDIVTLEGWALNITNKSTFFVRNVNSTDKVKGWKDWSYYYNDYVSTSIPNRFFGATTTPPYRVYWAIDPNYDNGDASYFNILSKQNPPTKWLGFTPETDIAYCLENTFDTEHMRQDQTTGIVFKARYTPKGSAEGSSFFMMGGTSRIYTEEEFVQTVNDILDLTGTEAIEKSDLKLDGTDGGTYTTSNITNLIPSNVLDGGSLTTLLNDPAIGNEIKFYKNGAVFYYATQIKHFGDYYTPIDDKGTTYVESTDDYTEENHLGRYGVVRNNWYEINVSGVAGPGEPEIPDEPNHPDDPKEAWIKCNINVLSWAVRKQEVTLK